jgi:hypothetical protein
MNNKDPVYPIDVPVVALVYKEKSDGDKLMNSHHNSFKIGIYSQLIGWDQL